MSLANRKPQTIDEYLATAKPDQRRTLAKVRKTIHAVAPAGFLRRMGESLLALSGQFHDAEKISGRSERFSDYQRDHSLLVR